MERAVEVEREPEGRFVEVDGRRLHYLDWGDKGKRAHVLLHGITGNAHNWDYLAPSWSVDSRVLALDQRGHGESERATEGYPVQAFASDLYAFARKLDLAPFDATGHSLGSRNLIAFAGDHSDMLSHLVLSDCGPELPQQGARNNNRRLGSRPAFFRTWQEAEAWYKETNPTWPREHTEQVMRHALRENYAGKWVWKHDPDLLWITGGFGLTEVPYLWQQCARITCKTLILHGGESEVLSPEILETMLSVMPNASVHHFKGASHNILLEARDELEKVVREFLRS